MKTSMYSTLSPLRHFCISTFMLLGVLTLSCPFPCLGDNQNNPDQSDGCTGSGGNEGKGNCNNDCEPDDCEQDDETQANYNYNIGSNNECNGSGVNVGNGDDGGGGGAYYFQKYPYKNFRKQLDYDLLAKSFADGAYCKLKGAFYPGYVSQSSVKSFGSAAKVMWSGDATINQVKGSKGMLNLSSKISSSGMKEMSMDFYPSRSLTGKISGGKYTVVSGASPTRVVKFKENAVGDAVYRESVNYKSMVPSIKGMKMTQTPIDSKPNAVRLCKTYSRGMFSFQARSATNDENLDTNSYRRVTTDISSVENGEPFEEKYIATVEEIGTDGIWRMVGRKSGRRAFYKEADGLVPLYECDAVNEDGTPIVPIATETTYTYYTNPLQTKTYGKIRTLRRNDGYWENKYYDVNDSAGISIEKTESPWLNTSAHEPGQTPNGSIRTKVKVVCSTDQGSSSETEEVDGIVISKKWTDKTPIDKDKVKEVLYEPHSGGVKITTTIRYRKADDIPLHLNGMPISIEYPDGKHDYYRYQEEGGNYIITHDFGYGNGSNSISNGHRNVVTKDLKNRKIREEIRYALKDGQSFWLGSRTGVEFDPGGNCLKWIYNNDPEDYYTESRDCCEVTWKRDRDGTETWFTYSPKGDLIEKKNKGIIYTTEIKGLLKVERRRSEGEDTSYLVAGKEYNMAGQLTKFTTAASEGKENGIIYEYNIGARTEKETRTADGAWKLTTYSPDGNILSVTGTVGKNYLCRYIPASTNGGGIIIRNISLDEHGQETSFISEVATDLLGNVVSSRLVNTAGMTGTYYQYDSAGRSICTTSPDGEQQRMVYDGETVITGYDMDHDGALDPQKDRINRVALNFDFSWPEQKGAWKYSFEVACNQTWNPVKTVWITDDGTCSRISLAGAQGYEYKYSPTPKNAVNHVFTAEEISFWGSRRVTEYTKAPQGFLNSIKVVNYDSEGNVVSQYEDIKDAWENTIVRNDGRLGQFQYAYDSSSGYLMTAIDPEGRLTRYNYDILGRVTKMILPDGSIQENFFDTKGNLKRTWGSRKYSISYTYDYEDRIIAQTTYPQGEGNTANPFGEAGQTTQWIYDPASGFIVAKQYPDGSRELYERTPGGKLSFVVNARGNHTTYGYDAGGAVISISHNDKRTPTSYFQIDYSGRLKEAYVEGVSRYLYEYSMENVMTVSAEDVSLFSPQGETLNRKIEYQYDAYGSIAQYKLKNGDHVESEADFSYNPYGQISQIKAGIHSFLYSYQPMSPLQVVAMEGPVHKVINNYALKENYLIQRKNSLKNTDERTISSIEYSYDILHQKIRALAIGKDSSRNFEWSYDSQGHLTKETNNASTATTNTYLYDQIGNRMEVLLSDGESVFYRNNAVNQCIQAGAYSPVYDADGNLLHGLPCAENSERNLLQFEYDNANRPVSIKLGNDVLSKSCYDHEGRRIYHDGKFTLYHNGSPLADYQAGNSKILFTYLWGLDESGKIDGAGGAGGLLAVTSYLGMIESMAYPLYDGQGNITEYISNSGEVVAHYQYDAYGNILEKYGEMADSFVFRFSTKRYDSKTGTYYYLYRDYDPMMGRWLTRDPLGEEGGENLYGFVRNNPINLIDEWGLYFPSHSDAATGAPGVNPDRYEQVNRNIGQGIGESIGSTLDAAAQAADYVASGQAKKDLEDVNDYLKSGKAAQDMKDLASCLADPCCRKKMGDSLKGEAKEKWDSLMNSLEDAWENEGKNPGELTGRAIGDILQGLGAGGVLGAAKKAASAAKAGNAIDKAKDAAKAGAKADGASVAKPKRGGDSAAAKKGREEHKKLTEKVDAKGNGWKSEKSFDGQDGKQYRPDITTPKGNFVELKPNTPSGRAQGEKQMNNYLKQAPNRADGQRPQGKVIYYNP